MDETGTVLTPQQVVVLLARALLRYEPGSQVIYDERLGSAVGTRSARSVASPLPCALDRPV